LKALYCHLDFSPHLWATSVEVPEQSSSESLWALRLSRLSQAYQMNTKFINPRRVHDDDPFVVFPKNHFFKFLYFYTGTQNLVHEKSFWEILRSQVPEQHSSRVDVYVHGYESLLLNKSAPKELMIHLQQFDDLVIRETLHQMNAPLGI